MEQANIEPVIIEDLVRFGHSKGYNQCRADDYVREFARRLGRALTDREGATLSQRVKTLSVDRLDDVLFNSTRKALAAWLADPAAR